MNSYYFSKKLRRNLIENSEKVPPGSAHYSYGNVAEKFIDSFQRSGVLGYELVRPEIYCSPPVELGGRALPHLIFKPFEEIRVLNGAQNIAHVAWEFPKLPNRSDWLVGDRRFYDPFSDYLMMLKVPNRIWVGCSYTKEVFASYGLNNVDIVPAPIPALISSDKELYGVRDVLRFNAKTQLKNTQAISLSELLRADKFPVTNSSASLSLTSVIESSDKCYLSVVNPGDLRKNLPNLIDGFSQASKKSSHRISLFIKLTIDNKFVTLNSFIKGSLPALYEKWGMNWGEIEPHNVYLISDYLTDVNLNALYAASDFYLTATIAEGQNLPLQEAMALGTVPVSPIHTAMRDYLDDSDSIGMNSPASRAYACFEEAYGISNFSLNISDSQDVAAAIHKSLALNVKAYRALQKSGWQKMFLNYSPQKVIPKAIQLIERLGG